MVEGFDRILRINEVLLPAKKVTNITLNVPLFTPMPKCLIHFPHACAERLTQSQVANRS